MNEGWGNFVRISCGWGWFYYDLLRNWDDFFFSRLPSAAMKYTVAKLH